MLLAPPDAVNWSSWRRAMHLSTFQQKNEHKALIIKTPPLPTNNIGERTHLSDSFVEEVGVGRSRHQPPQLGWGLGHHLLPLPDLNEWFGGGQWEDWSFRERERREKVREDVCMKKTEQKEFRVRWCNGHVGIHKTQTATLVSFLSELKRQPLPRLKVYEQLRSFVSFRSIMIRQMTCLVLASFNFWYLYPLN